MAKLSIDDLTKRDNALKVYNKIISKNDNLFELFNGDEVELKFNPDIKGIDKLFKEQDITEIKAASISKLTKMFFVGKDKKEYKITDLKKSSVFGGGSGSGGGAQDTAITESMQCYYNALRYTLGTDLNSKNATSTALKKTSLRAHVHVYEKSKRFEPSELIDLHSQKSLLSWMQVDDKGLNVYMKTANALAKDQKWSGVPFFHRGSPFMKAVYESKKLALEFDKKQEVQKAPAAGYSDDKWNPGDIWMSTFDPNPVSSKPLDFGKGGSSCNLTFQQLKEEVYEKAMEKKLLGVSLKKVKGSANITKFNLPDRIQNTNVSLTGFRFGKDGSFFSSTDVYLVFGGGKEMQLRSYATTKSWQGEVKGVAAAGGKIGGGGVNFYCNDILKTTIGKNPKDAFKWKETKWSDSLFDDFYNLYETYSNNSGNIKRFKPVDKKTFIANANGYVFKGRNASPAFKFSKYMGLLMIDAVYGKNNGKRKEWATKVLRYAMSNIDISSYFIKIE